jgi:hypothetical protein
LESKELVKILGIIFVLTIATVLLLDFGISVRFIVIIQSSHGPGGLLQSNDVINRACCIRFNGG